MPLLNYACSCGEITKKYVKHARDSASFIVCPNCGLEARKSFGETSVGHKIVIDNGLMARSVELQSPDIMEINDERSALDLSED
jgi:hypothetical protein